MFYDFFILVRDALSVQVILHSVNWASGTKGLSFSKTATRATQLHVCPAPDWKQLFGLGYASQQTKQFAALFAITCSIANPTFSNPGNAQGKECPAKRSPSATITNQNQAKYVANDVYWNYIICFYNFISIYYTVHHVYILSIFCMHVYNSIRGYTSVDPIQNGPTLMVRQVTISQQAIRKRR